MIAKIDWGRRILALILIIIIYECYTKKHSATTIYCQDN